jgi:hypothetical protein
MRYTSLLLLLFVISAGSERAYSQSCPQFSVACPDSIDTSPITFAVRTGNDLSNKRTFKWTVSAGKIVGGQGTSSIIVDANGIEEKSITATVEVGGLPEGCGNVASCSTPTICPPPPSSRKFDEYGDLSWAEEKARLDKFAGYLEPGIRLRSHRKKLSRESSNPGNRIRR